LGSLQPADPTDALSLAHFPLFPAPLGSAFSRAAHPGARLVGASGRSAAIQNFAIRLRQKIGYAF
jgi:hypothetical protein